MTCHVCGAVYVNVADYLKHMGREHPDVAQVIGR